MNPRLDTLRQMRGVWIGTETAAVPAIASGHLALDRQLPGHGWPRASLIEVLPAANGIGEISLLLPALRRLVAEKRIAFVQPPFVPYAPALANSGLPLERIAWIDAKGAEAQWAAEQSLRSGAISCVLYWGASQDTTELRRLQLAAEAGNALVFLFRPISALAEASMATVRLVLTPQNGKLRIDLLKARGGRPGVVLVDPFRRSPSSEVTGDPLRPHAPPVRRAALTACEETVASEGRSRFAGAQEPECTQVHEGERWLGRSTASPSANEHRRSASCRAQ